MNIYTEKFIAERHFITGVTYQTDRSKHSESVVLNIQEGSSGKGRKHYFSHNAAMYSAWMQILDYGMPDDRKTPDILLDLENTTRSEFSIPKRPTERLIAAYLDGMSAASYAEIAGGILKALEQAITARPVLGYLYPVYYDILCTMRLYAKKKMKLDRCVPILFAAYRILDQELNGFASVYKNARVYCDAVFLTANQPSDSHLPADIAQVYHSYCLDNNHADFHADSLSAMTLQPSSLDFTDITGWPDYLNHFLQESAGGKKKEVPITSFAQFLHIGIDRMLETESVLRVCKLCGGYFRIRYSVTQEYCTRLYGKTKATCNEYASRKSYKDRLFQHPIHTEFTKSYNRLYGRIRRGKLPEDTPLMDELKALHDEYHEKYENTHRQEREAVWREYMAKNKELLG